MFFHPRLDYLTCLRLLLLHFRDSCVGIPILVVAYRQFVGYVWSLCVVLVIFFFFSFFYYFLFFSLFFLSFLGHKL